MTIKKADILKDIDAQLAIIEAAQAEIRQQFDRLKSFCPFKIGDKTRPICRPYMGKDFEIDEVAISTGAYSRGIYKRPQGLIVSGLVLKKKPEAGIALYPLSDGQRYCSIVHATVRHEAWRNTPIDLTRLAAGEVYLDRKSAEQKLAAMQTEQLMCVSSYEAWLEVGEELDWCSASQDKWHFYLCRFHDLSVNHNWSRECKHPFPTLQSIEAFRTKVGDEAIINMIKWLGV